MAWEDAAQLVDWSGAMASALRCRLMALQTASGGTMRTRSVLLVGDDSETRQLLHLILERAGFRVDSAAHRNEALMLLRRSLPSMRPDLVITDADMPNPNDGAALLREIRSDPRLDRIRTILMSWDQSDSEGVEFDAFVAKQRLQPELTDALVRLLD
jgi:CheY-like chemotaxis protein